MLLLLSIVYMLLDFGNVVLLWLIRLFGILMCLVDKVNMLLMLLFRLCVVSVYLFGFSDRVRCELVLFLLLLFLVFMFWFDSFSIGLKIFDIRWILYRLVLFICRVQFWGLLVSMLMILLLFVSGLLLYGISFLVCRWYGLQLVELLVLIVIWQVLLLLVWKVSEMLFLCLQLVLLLVIRLLLLNMVIELFSELVSFSLISCLFFSLIWQSWWWLLLLQLMLLCEVILLDIGLLKLSDVVLFVFVLLLMWL